MGRKEYNKKYYLEHKGRKPKRDRKEYNRKYYLSHKEANREHDAEYMREYRKKHRESFYKSGAAEFASMSAHISKQGLSRSWSRNDFLSWFERQKKECYYCKRTLSVLPVGRLEGLSLDRLNPNKGYEEENVVLCCGRCNVIKGNWFTYEQMLEIGTKYLRGKVNLTEV